MPLRKRNHVIKQTEIIVMLHGLAFLFGCIPEITKDCQDMTNASSAYLGIAVGAVIGGVISLWIYYHQKKISDIQDLTLNKIRQYDEHNEIILKKMQALDVRHEEILHKILDLAQKIDGMERQRSTTSKSE